jgi:hypothetical protein
VHAAGGTLVLPHVVPTPAGWARIASALDAEPGALEEIVAAEVAAVLRSWRPRGPERGLTVFCAAAAVMG